MADLTHVIVSELPDCDYCKMEGNIRPARYDARTIHGPWANMCHLHFLRMTSGRLGTGIGQELIPGHHEAT